MIPLSCHQRQLWTLEQLKPGRTDYVMPIVLRLRGSLDLDALVTAVRAVVARHEMLRCRISAGTHQDFLPAGEVSVTDLSARSPDEGEREALRLATSDARTAFDLTRDVLFRARVIRMSATDHLLVLVAHHIVADGWSMGVVLNEISAVYQGGLLPQPVAGYHSFVAWQESWQRSDDYAEQVEYWRERLAGAPRTELPTDHRRPEVPSGQGASLRFAFPVDVVDLVQGAAREHRATTFMVLLAGFQALLALYTAEDDVVVGTAMSGRTREEWDRVVGAFVNTVVLRTALCGEPTFTDALARVRDVALQAYVHQDVPFDDVVRRLAPDRTAGRNPFFQVMFELQDDDRLRLPDIAVSSVDIGSGSAKFDLTCVVTAGPDGLSGDLTYAVDLFDGSTMDDLARQYVRLLRAALTEPGTPLTQLDLVRDQDRDLMLGKWRGRWAVRPNRCVHELFEQQVRTRPRAVAVRCGEHELSYVELDALANRLAGELHRRGVGPGVPVAVVLPRSPDLVVAALAVFKTGGVYAPADPGLPAPRLATIVANLDAPVVLAERPVSGCGDRVLLRPGQWPHFATGDLPPVRSTDLATIFHTSGSTGAPKGVAVRHMGIVNYLGYLAEEFGLCAEDVVLALAAPSFDASLRDMFGPLTTGGQLVFTPPDVDRDPAAVLETVKRHGVTALLSLVPAWLSALRTAGTEGWQGIRMALVSGETLSPQLAEDVLASGLGCLVNQYGPTECTMTSTFHRVRRADLRDGPIPIGRPIPNMRCYVLGGGMRLLPKGALGELYLGGPGVAAGYHGAPGLTAARFVADPFGPPGSILFRTGDLVRWRADGNLEFHGRCDHQVKIRGVRVEPAEVEAALVREPGVVAAVVTAQGEPPATELAAHIVPPTVDVERLRSHLAATLPSQLVPTRYALLAELPMTRHGKVDRSRLPVARAPVTATSSAPPRTPLEKTVVGVWRRELDAGEVGVRDNFFSLGGHSLTAVRIAEQIAAELGAPVSPYLVFRNPTVETLCEELARNVADVVVPMAEGSSGRQPLFLVHPHAGDVFCYRELVTRMRLNRTVYGVEAVGYSTEERPLATIEGMAARYLAEIAAVTAGPYLFAGWSLGGNVAFEMTRRIERAGGRVAFLGIVEARVFGVDGGTWERTPGPASAAPSNLTSRMARVREANTRAAQAYRPTGRISSDILLVKADGVHESLPCPDVNPDSWQERTTGRVATCVVPGNHHDLMSEPWVGAVARTLAEAVDGRG
jgi:amino acid adenylation domain-containing protein